MTTTMSKLLHFGMAPDDVVLRATATPAKILGLEGIAGTRRPRASANVAILELHDGACEFHDSDRNTVTG
jgi:predicted amidohydrolase